MLSDIYLFKPFKPIESTFPLLESGIQHVCSGIKGVEATLLIRTTSCFKVTLENVYYAPTASSNLISLYKLKNMQTNGHCLQQQKLEVHTKQKQE